MFTTRHAAGKSNATADIISCFEFQRLHQLAPYVSPTASCISFGLGPAACNLDQKCQFYLTKGLAPLTRQVYRSAQHQFIDWFFSAYL